MSSPDYNYSIFKYRRLLFEGINEVIERNTCESVVQPVFVWTKLTISDANMRVRISPKSYYFLPIGGVSRCW